VADAVYCLSPDEPKANTILTHLRSLGFSSEISVLLESDSETRNISVRENAVRGATIGSVAGALLALAVPGMGAALAAGPIATLLAGAAAGGVVGGLAGGSGAFAPLNLPEEVEDRLHERLSAGDILVAVHSDDPQKLQIALDVFHAGEADFIYDARGQRDQHRTRRSHRQRRKVQ
jgi:hypothetical protein